MQKHLYVVQLFLWPLKNLSYTWWPPGDFSVRILQHSSFRSSKLCKTLRSLIPLAVCLHKETTSKSPINHTFTLSLVLFFLQDTVTWTWDLLSCNFSFFVPCFSTVTPSLWLLFPRATYRKALPAEHSGYCLVKRLFYSVISEANSRLGAKHASLLLRFSLSKRTERIWKVRSSDAEVRHFSYGTALKTL